jgi:hypothetical protein
MSAKRKQSTVLRLLKGEPIELVSRELGVTAAERSAWRDAFLAGGEGSLKTRPVDDRDAEIDRLKTKVGDLTMANELLEAKIEKLEGGRLWAGGGRGGERHRLALHRPCLWRGTDLPRLGRRPRHRLPPAAAGRGTTEVAARPPRPDVRRRAGRRHPRLARGEFLSRRRLSRHPSARLLRAVPLPTDRSSSDDRWARLRFAGIRTSKRRILRLTREHGLQAPHRVGRPRGPHASRPLGRWAKPSSAKRRKIQFRRRRGQKDRAGPHRFGAFGKAVAAVTRLRRNHRRQFFAGDFQAELAFLGLGSSPAFVREPEGNGCVARFIRVLKENLLWLRHFETVEELRHALLAVQNAYNRGRILQRHGHRTPRQVSSDQAAAALAA